MAKNAVPFMLLWAIAFAVFTGAIGHRDGVGGVDVVFCGNPGVGKSTLLSSISGLLFESGVSWGSGLTNKLEMKDSPSLPGVRFGDTPGLADVSMAKQAAAAIVEALKEASQSRRTLKLFFVVTLESGRIRDNDLFTIKQVMESIAMPDGSSPGPNSFGVIINKCDIMARSDFETRGKPTLRRFLSEKSESIPFTTSVLHFLPLVSELTAADNRKHDFQGLRDFVLNFPGLRAIGEVREINIANLHEQLEEYKRLVEESRKHKELLEESSKRSEEDRKLIEESAQRQGIMHEVAELVQAVSPVAITYIQTKAASSALVTVVGSAAPFITPLLR